MSILLLDDSLSLIVADTFVVIEKVSSINFCNQNVTIRKKKELMKVAAMRNMNIMKMKSVTVISMRINGKCSSGIPIKSNH